MKNPQDLQKNVQDAIKWKPLLHETEVGVAINNGVVILTGTVDCYSKKLEAENAAKNIAGVKALVEKIEVHLENSLDKKDDNEIAEEIAKAYKRNWHIPNDKIKVKVENGKVILTGELNWHYQKEEAKNTINNLKGIVSVTNGITIKSDNVDVMEKEVIEQHIQQSWALNADDIKVKVDGSKVTLNGTVSSLCQKEEAGRIAWNTPGICNLENNLYVQ